jgi:hypothetical protein
MPRYTCLSGVIVSKVVSPKPLRVVPTAARLQHTERGRCEARPEGPIEGAAVKRALWFKEAAGVLVVFRRMLYRRSHEAFSRNISND